MAFNANKRFFGDDIPIWIKLKMYFREWLNSFGPHDLKDNRDHVTSFAAFIEEQKIPTFVGNDVFMPKHFNSSSDMIGDASSRTPFVRAWVGLQLSNMTPYDLKNDLIDEIPSFNEKGCTLNDVGYKIDPKDKSKINGTDISHYNAKFKTIKGKLVLVSRSGTQPKAIIGDDRGIFMWRKSSDDNGLVQWILHKVINDPAYRHVYEIGNHIYNQGKNHDIYSSIGDPIGDALYEYQGGMGGRRVATQGIGGHDTNRMYFGEIGTSEDETTGIGTLGSDDYMPYAAHLSKVFPDQLSGTSIYSNIYGQDDPNFDENDVSSTGDAHKSVLDNPFLEAPMGITSFTLDTLDSMGMVQKGFLNFTVHSFHDFENIVMRYFVKPGQKIFVDFGYNVDELYQPQEFLYANIDLGESVEYLLYNVPEADDIANKTNDHVGYSVRNLGDTRTFMGTVTNWNVNVRPDGGWDITLELLSGTAAIANAKGFNPSGKFKKHLMERLDNIIFDVQIHQWWLKMVKWARGDAWDKDAPNYDPDGDRPAYWAALDTEIDFGFVKIPGQSKPLEMGKWKIQDIMQVLTNDVDIYNDFEFTGFREIFSLFFHAKFLSTPGGSIPDEAKNFPYGFSLETGVYWGMSDFNAMDDLSSAKKDIILDDKRKFINIGFLEDEILTYGLGFGQSKNEMIYSSKSNDGNAIFNSQNSFITWTRSMSEAQQASIPGSEIYLLPFVWGHPSSYNFKKGLTPTDVGSGQRPDSVTIHGKTFNTNDIPRWYHDTQANRMPFRELFISYALVKEAILKTEDPSSAYKYILKRLNEATDGLWNLNLGPADELGRMVQAVDINKPFLTANAPNTTAEIGNMGLEAWNNLYSFSPGSEDNQILEFNLSFKPASKDLNTFFAISTGTGRDQGIPVNTFLDKWISLDTIFDPLWSQLKPDAQHMSPGQQIANADLDGTGDYNPLDPVGAAAVGQAAPSKFANQQVLAEKLLNAGTGNDFDPFKSWTVFSLPYWGDRGTLTEMDAINNELSWKFDRDAELALGDQIVGSNLSQGDVFNEYDPDHIRTPVSPDLQIMDESYKNFLANPQEMGNEWQTFASSLLENMTDWEITNDDVVYNNLEGQFANPGKSLKEMFSHRYDDDQYIIVDNPAAYWKKITNTNFVTKQFTPLLPVDLTMKIQGISGIMPGHMFKVDYLPEPQRSLVYFQNMKTTQEVTPAGWTTTLQAQMLCRSLETKRLRYQPDFDPDKIVLSKEYINDTCGDDCEFGFRGMGHFYPQNSPTGRYLPEEIAWIFTRTSRSMSNLFTAYKPVNGLNTKMKEWLGGVELFTCEVDPLQWVSNGASVEAWLEGIVGSGSPVIQAWKDVITDSGYNLTDEQYLEDQDSGPDGDPTVFKTQPFILGFHPLDHSLNSVIKGSGTVFDAFGKDPKLAYAGGKHSVDLNSSIPGLKYTWGWVLRELVDKDDFDRYFNVTSFSDFKNTLAKNLTETAQWRENTNYDAMGWMDDPSGGHWNEEILMDYQLHTVGEDEMLYFDMALWSSEEGEGNLNQSGQGIDGKIIDYYTNLYNRIAKGYDDLVNNQFFGTNYMNWEHYWVWQRYLQTKTRYYFMICKPHPHFNFPTDSKGNPYYLIFDSLAMADKMADQMRRLMEVYSEYQDDLLSDHDNNRKNWYQKNLMHTWSVEEDKQAENRMGKAPVIAKHGFLIGNKQLNTAWDLPGPGGIRYNSDGSEIDLVEPQTNIKIQHSGKNTSIQDWRYPNGWGAASSQAAYNLGAVIQGNSSAAALNLSGMHPGIDLSNSGNGTSYSGMHVGINLDTDNDPIQINGCFDGFGKVSMSDGSYKLVKDIIVGDEVKTENGVSKISKIWKEPTETELYEYNNVQFTTHHWINLKGEWVFPKDIGTLVKPKDEYMYNFALENNDEIDLIYPENETFPTFYGHKNNFYINDVLVSSSSDIVLTISEIANKITSDYIDRDIKDSEKNFKNNKKVKEELIELFNNFV